MGLIGLVSVVLVLVFIYFAPFLVIANSFDVMIGNGESIIQNNGFGIEFRVNSECDVKNRYHRYSGVTLWDGLLICEKDYPNTALHLVVSKDVDGMIGGTPYHDLKNVFYDELRPEIGILRILSNDGKYALLITTYSVSGNNNKLWNDVLDSIHLYKK